jgi:hypothetical protein
MESEIERLRAMLAVQDVWETPAEFELFSGLSSDAKSSRDTDENFPSYDYQVERDLEQLNTSAGGKMAIHSRRMAFNQLSLKTEECKTSFNMNLRSVKKPLNESPSVRLIH